MDYVPINPVKHSLASVWLAGLFRPFILWWRRVCIRLIGWVDLKTGLFIRIEHAALRTGFGLLPSPAGGRRAGDEGDNRTCAQG